MRKKRLPDVVLYIMKHLNLMILLYISTLLVYCLNGYIHEKSAQQFLNTAKIIPLEPWKAIIVPVGLYVCLLLLMSIRAERNVELYLKTIVEVVICGFLFTSLNYSYSGFVLLVLANAIRRVSDSKSRIIVITVTFLSYILFDYNVLSMLNIRIMPAETVLAYYQGTAMSLILAILDMLKIANIFLFIGYMFVLIMDQISQTRLVLELNDELAEKNTQLIDMNAELEEATKTKERNRLAREIHDTLGHTLTGIITGVDACAMIIDIAPDVAKQQLNAIADIARGGMKDVRRSVNALRPDVLEKKDLFEALQEMVESTRKSTGVEMNFACCAALDCFNQDEEDVIYRIVQEGTTNAIRHGKATRVDIRIERNFDTLWIEIRDNGIGCTDVKKGFGIHHMEERLKMLNGALEYDGSNGFWIKAKLPIRWGE